VKESFIEWNPELQETYWTMDQVEGDPSLSYLLNSPLQAFDHYWPHLSRPEHATDLEWTNHIFALAVIVCEYIALLRNQPIHFSINEVKDELLRRGTIRNFTKVELKESKRQKKEWLM
jgi:hypothetical protein